MVTPADLRNRFPADFEASEDGDLQTAIDSAELRVRSDLGTLRDEALIFLAAHLATMSAVGATGGGSGGGPGGAQSITVGPVSVSYGAKAGGETGGSASTRYLEEYFALLNSIPRVRFLTG